MHDEFKQILLETLADIKSHPDGQDGVAFVSVFPEEPDWEVILAFRPKTTGDETFLPEPTTLQ